MEVNGNFDFKGVGKLKRPGLVATDFPSNPSIGELVLKDKKLYLCIEIDNMPYWVSLVNEISMYRHDQTIPALEWTISHALNTGIVMAQVYDSGGNQVIPNNISCAYNQTTVTFSVPTAGVALLTSGDTAGLPRANYAYTEDIVVSSTTWVITHNLGYNPSVTVIVGGYVVQPLSIVHNSVNQCTITFTSAQVGSVRCV